MSDKKTLKITDRRMFTQSGELRDDYRHLESAEVQDREPPAPEPQPPEPQPREPQPPEPQPPEPQPSEPEPGQPAFVDLVSLLAENASVYLQQAGVPDGQQDQNLEMSRLHIDLLGVLKDKTSGNLNPQEQKMIDDVLYQLRSAFSSQRGF